MRRKQKKNLVRYRKPFHLNIGIVIILFLAIYFLASFISYLTGAHVTVYEVKAGQIVQSSYYTGLVLREETVTYASESGSINYYIKEGDKAGYNDLVCSIDKEGSLSQEITAAGLDGTSLSRDELLEVQELITDYSLNYSSLQFYQLYSFKENLNASVQENLYLSALASLSGQTNSGTFSLVRATTDGILAFYTDGYESITTETFTPSMYQPSEYKKTNLKTNTTVSSGQALYKTVTNENWYLMVPIDAEEKEYYQEMIAEGDESFIIYVTFRQDGATTYATATINDYDGEYFLQLAFNSSMIRYVSQRYLEIELGSDAETGLKIPNSSIVEKEFLLIPEDCFTKGNNSTSYIVAKRIQEKDGSYTVEFVSTDRYSSCTINDKTYYYVDEEELSMGDELVLVSTVDKSAIPEGAILVSAMLNGDDEDSSTDTSDTVEIIDMQQVYTLSETGVLNGVYNINKGYAVFKVINILTANEEYTIVETGTSYGLSNYDRIALDGTSISEGDYAN